MPYWVSIITFCPPQCYFNYTAKEHNSVKNLLQFVLGVRLFWSVKRTQVLAFQTCSVECFRSILRLYPCINEYELRQWCRKYEASQRPTEPDFQFRTFGACMEGEIILSGIQTLSPAARGLHSEQ